MFILIWVTVLFAVGRNNAEANTHQNNSSGMTTHPSVKKQHTVWQTNTTEHLNATSKENVTTSSNINNTKELGTLTCVSSGEGLPLPTIKWQLLENHTNYSLITFGLNETINCTVTLTKTDNSKTTAECVSSNKNGDEDLKMMLLRLVKQPEIICAFLTGVLLTTILSTIICCLMSKCHRKKQKTYENLPDNLEMLISHRGPLMDDVQEVEYDQINDQEAAKAGGAEAAGKSDVDYSTIKFSALKRQARVEISGDTTETEYAEIKREKTEEGQDGEGNQEAVLIEEVEETNHDIPEEGEGEDVVLHSDVKDKVSEILELAVDVA